MWHYIKKIHNVDIKQMLSGETVPKGKRWEEKQPEIRQDITWGARQSAIEMITNGEFSTHPENIKTDKMLQLFREHYMPTRNTYHNSGIFSGQSKKKTKQLRKFEKKLVTVEQNSELKEMKHDDSLISKFVTNITDKK